MSEKLDFHRCFWDGGVTRGLPKSDVPWANCEKDERFINEQYATGLWTQLGNVYHAPDWWLDELPNIPLDGELGSLKRGVSARQEVSKIIKGNAPLEEYWHEIYIHVFDIPPLETVFEDGVIDIPNYSKILKGCLPWIEAQIWHYDYRPQPTSRYQSVMTRGVLELKGYPRCPWVEQLQLEDWEDVAAVQVQNFCNDITEQGGEGVMLRDPNAMYVCERVKHMLKVKPREDMEGTVIGYITGRETAKGSKLLGLMGSLVLQLDNGQRLEISGFTDAERALGHTNGDGHIASTAWAVLNPETECPDNMHAKLFPRGCRVTFKYRGVSKDGVPQEAFYHRERLDD
jgi:hypothetical protein